MTSFYNLESAEKFIKENKYKIILGKECSLYIKRSKNEFKSEANLVFSNLNKDTKISELEPACEEFGKVLSTKLNGTYISETKKFESFGYAFVQFENEEDAKKCQENMDGIDFKGNTIKVSIWDQ